MTKTILVIGGSGALGKPVAHLLLKYTENINVVIAGRDIKKAEKTANDLNSIIGKGERAKAISLDATDSEALRNAFKNIDLVVVCSPTTDFTAQVAKAALDTDTDYMDTHYPQGIIRILNKLSAEIKKTRRCFITQSGFHPGLPSVLVRYGAEYFSEYKKAFVNISIREHYMGSLDSAAEFIKELAAYKIYVFKNRKWHEASYYKDVKQVDFGHGVGLQACYPLQLEEMKELPEKYNLEETSLYITGFNWFTDYFVFPLATIVKKIFKNLFAGSLTKLFIWGIRTFSKPPFGVIMKLEAEGLKNGESKKLSVILRHTNAYMFTAIPIVACLLQYIDGTIAKPGLWYMGHIVNPKRLFKDMEKMGVQIEIEET